MKENWAKWQPVGGLSNKYNVDLIRYSIANGFQITFSECQNKEKKIIFTFKMGIDAYRQADENFMNHTIKKLKDLHGSDLYGNWTFFKVTDSLYLQWILEESYGTTESYPLIHYAFLAGNVILDVASLHDPIVEFIN
jgi:hypothetical protein